ncbi:MAG TPA: rhodanese-like domain-containing protein [Verrucomicrobiae bacterium]|nr:rhodanese-like domain-containing protein [Verrucomicrobiae bacterium]
MMKLSRLAVLSLLAVLILTFGSLTAGCSSSSKSASFSTISTATLQKMLESGDKFTLVDVREAGDFKRGHIGKALNMPIGQLESSYSQLDPNANIVLICYTGHTSQAAAQFLIDKKFTKVSSVSGGMNAWQGPTVK